MRVRDLLEGRSHLEESSSNKNVSPTQHPVRPRRQVERDEEIADQDHGSKDPSGMARKLSLMIRRSGTASHSHAKYVEFPSAATT